ncbi:hypothetical protein BB560_001896 [Smittium megazygosporum]|uniref:Ion transport domain-containing protein n=1 Tax=Smittium megazygosporum TaxID=133381 RepID=A0A2T9ZG97_9FUNG|nr:hypothetical protein BB560_001899 [Smittium megazygosporum]PVV03616.1 hypothetical protein BB560_001896 [Smittium megazygosporum]
MVFISLDYMTVVPLQYIRLLRVFRVFELFRYGQVSTPVKIVILAIERSLNQITAAVISVFVLMVMSSSVMFIVENSVYNRDQMVWYRMVDGVLTVSPFQSVPGTFYWAIVTLTTTGYGDQYPVTSMGQGVAIVTMLFGVAVIAIPTSIIGANLTHEWNTKEKMEHNGNDEKYQQINTIYNSNTASGSSNTLIPVSGENGAGIFKSRSNSVSNPSLMKNTSTSIDELKEMILNLDAQIKMLTKMKEPSVNSK